MLYTPLNKYKLTQEGRKIFDDIEKMKASNVKTVRLYPKQYDLLLRGVSLSERESCSCCIKHEDITIFRIRGVK